MLDVAKLKRAHEQYLRLQQREIYAAMVEAEAAELESVRTNPGFTRRSGKTQDSTKTKIIHRNGRKMVLRISNGTKVARIMEHGSRPHRITAKPGKMLRFWGFGQLIYRKTVMHPGTKAYSFLKRARQKGSSKFHQALEPRIRRIASQF